jgi:hypothetical protein
VVSSTDRDSHSAVPTRAAIWRECRGLSTTTHSTGGWEAGSPAMNGLIGFGQVDQVD